jgi:hypothetical protein
MIAPLIISQLEGTDEIMSHAACHGPYNQIAEIHD